MAKEFRMGIWFLMYICLCTVRNIDGKKIHAVEDFLFHETAGVPPAPKRDYDSSQYPPLRSPSEKPNGQQNYQPIITPGKNQQANGKRDYVAHERPTSATGTTQKPSQMNEKKDFGSPQHPTRSPAIAHTPSTTMPSTIRPSQSNGKRDYVNPLHPNTPSSHQSGSVKDLINFYDKKDKNPQNIPSYSSVLNGKGGHNPTSITTGTMASVTPLDHSVTPAVNPKPLSFSSVVAGTNKQGQISTSSAWGNVFTTPKPTVAIPLKHDSTTLVNRNTPTQRPLPSSLANKNKNQNAVSTGPISDSEIEVLSEELLRKDTNNAAKYVTINYQEKTNSQSQEDKAPLPLLVVPNNVWNIPTITKILPLLDNYERDTLVNEYVTPQEKNEENEFVDAIMSTAVIRHLMNFLKVKGIVTPDPKQQRDFLKQLWFSLYSRGKGKISSSGFEHIFLSELKNGEVSGLHNWIYFAREEGANRLNYLGYLRYAEISDKGAVVKMHFNQQGIDKPVDTMFVGTSPELEIALYTLCFVSRADKSCKLKLGGQKVNIVSHTFRYRSKNLIGSAYPQIM